MELGLLLIPLLILTSGGIAYIGNLVGRNIGRRRLTLFGLRPRHTATAITIVSGMLITVVTLAAVLLVNEDARTALFRSRALQAELDRLEQQIDEAGRRLAALKRGEIAYLRNQEVIRGIIDARRPLREIVADVDALRRRAVDLALDNGIGVDTTTGSVLLLFPSNLTWDNVATLIDEHPGETIVRIVANENTLRDEPLEVSVQLVDNRLAYRAGVVLAAAEVDGRRPREEIGERLLELVDRAGEEGRRYVLSPPLARITAPAFLQVDFDVARNAARQIAGLRRTVAVEVVVLRDAFTAGPIVVGFRVRS